MIDEVNWLINELDISVEDAEEIINTYFECCLEDFTYIEYLRDEIRVLKKTEENKKIIEKLEEYDADFCFVYGDDYVLVFNYTSAIQWLNMEDFIPNHPF